MTARKQRHRLSWPGDRRSGRRFAIAADLEYRIVQDQQVVQSGTGRTLNLSNTGILFESGEALPVGAEVELLVAWPARLDNEVALNFCVSGHVSRSAGQRYAIRIMEHEFRLRGRYKAAGLWFPRPFASLPQATLLH